VLDAILDNETELTILEHATDTAGYTELVFALFDLLGLQFAPRLRDLGNQQLYRMTRDQRVRHLAPRFKGTIRQELIRLCRKFLCGDEMRAVASVGGMIRRPGRRTVRLP
jgi:TnpA family transposase